MGSIAITWYVLFTSNYVTPRWFHFFMKKKFLHCSCFKDMPYENPVVYMVDPNTAFIRPEVLSVVNSERMATNLSGCPNTTILKYTSTLDFENKLFTIWNMAPTCVTVVKMYLGITAKAQTPHQLYKHLLKLGATQI